MKLARSFSPPAAFGYCEREDFPGPGVQSDDEFLAAATQRGQTTFHPGSPVAWGPRATRRRGRRCLAGGWDEALRFVDVSIMPRIISANLNASTLMIADKAADLIRGRPALEPAAV